MSKVVKVNTLLQQLPSKVNAKKSMYVESKLSFFSLNWLGSSGIVRALV